MKTEKRCPKHNDGAGAMLPASAFYVVKNRQGKESLAGYCKECSKKIAMEYHREHPSEAAAAVRRVFEKHPEERKEYAVRRPAGYGAKWMKESRRKSPLKHWKWSIKFMYGVTPEWYEAKFAEQGGTCALCPNTHSDGRKLSIDHNHVTGKLRGLLCARCNATLERVEIDGWCKKALAYLEHYAAV